MPWGMGVKNNNAWSRLCAWVRETFERWRDKGTIQAPEEGQATLEYVAVALGIAAVVAALGALVRLGKRGMFTRISLQAASHVVGGSNPADALFDVFLY